MYLKNEKKWEILLIDNFSGWMITCLDILQGIVLVYYSSCLCSPSYLSHLVYFILNTFILHPRWMNKAIDIFYNCSMLSCYSHCVTWNTCKCKHIIYCTSALGVYERVPSVLQGCYSYLIISECFKIQLFNVQKFMWQKFAKHPTCPAPSNTNWTLNIIFFINLSVQSAACKSASVHCGLQC